MATTPEQAGTAAGAVGASRLDALAGIRPLLSYALLALAAGLAAIPIYLVATRKLPGGLTPTFFWGAGLSLLSLGIGLGNLTAQPRSKAQEVELVRKLALIYGGLAGALTAVFGALLALVTYREAIGEGLEAWRKTPQALAYPLLAIVGGLGFGFVVLQMGRGLERSNPVLRRLIYGAHAVLVGLLLLAVLTLLNVFAYAAPFSRVMGRNYSWTRTQLYDLAPATRSELLNLKEPVKVYVLMPPNWELTQDVTTLLENCRAL